MIFATYFGKNICITQTMRLNIGNND